MYLNNKPAGWLLYFATGSSLLLSMLQHLEHSLPPVDHRSSYIQIMGV